MIASEMISFIYDMDHERLNRFQQQRLTPRELEKLAQAIHSVGLLLTDCWDLWMALLEEFVAQVKCRVQCIMDTSVVMQ